MGANASHEPLKGGELSSGRKFPNGTLPNIRPSVRSSIRKSLRRRKGKHKAKHSQDVEMETTQTKGHSEPHSRTMEKLKRTLSMKKKKEQHIPESSKPHIWQTDESSVHQGTCSFCVKYLGCVEVFESRGMQVCEEALRVLRQNSRRRPVRGILYISGDGLRVVDDDTKGLLVDQTIEKVSFCAPDRHHERGFSYICRDGTTRRWMCHGFIASKESGERLSHAVGCAFAACLQRKQRRDQDSGVTMSFDQTTSTFTRMGSFKQMSMTERLSDPQECKPIENTLPLKKVENPHAIARPHATPQLLQRQGSFRVFSHLNQSSPFKRQLSLRLCDLPSNLERTRSMSVDNASSVENAANLLNNNTNNVIVEPFENENVSERIDYDRSSNANSMPPIPESSALVNPNTQDAVSAMCQQVSAGLSLLSSFQETFSSSKTGELMEGPESTTEPVSTPDKELLDGGINWSASNQQVNNEDLLKEQNSANLSKGEEWLAQLHPSPVIPQPRSIGGQRRNPMMQYRSASLGMAPSSNFSPPVNSHASTNGSGTAPKTTSDPFDADWAALTSKAANPNNPFMQPSTTKAFEIRM